MRKWLFYFSIIMIFLEQSSIAQQKKTMDIDDAFNEMGGKLSLHFFDAITV